MNEIQLIVTIEEGDLIVNALGNLPFVQVHTLIHKLQSQASTQISEDKPPPPPEAA